MYIKSTKIIEALLQHGADISIVDAHGNSPLHIACEEDSLEMVKVLFEYQMSHRAKYEKIMKIRNNQGIYNNSLKFDFRCCETHFNILLLIVL